MGFRGHTDDDLMRAIAAGDAVASAELMHRHRNWVCNLLYAFTRHKEQAEDLTQEVFCRVVRNADDYVGQGQFPAWLKRIAVNLGRNHLARDRRATVSLSECEEVLAADRRTDPMALAMDAVLHTAIREAIQSLPDDQKRTLILRYFSGMTVLEIAGVMQCPEGTVKSRLFHGLRRIRQQMVTYETSGENAS
ncbi:MAG: polymerase sigma-E factor [Chthonomonadales bacterium]|nr:polymerase sigma-E factor [Chthonomonadales bacterium]